MSEAPKDALSTSTLAISPVDAARADAFLNELPTASSPQTADSAAASTQHGENQAENTDEPASWTVEHVSAWLLEVDEGKQAKYVQKLAEEDVDGEALLLLDDNDLRNIGIPLGARKRLLRDIAGLRKRRRTG